MADGTVVIDTNLDSTGFEKGIEKLKNTASSGAKLAATGIAAVGTALTGLGTYAVKVGSDFEAGMSKVQAISGATSEDMEQLSAKAKEMGASTKFSATESAEAMQYMAMAGWKTQDMLDGIGGIMNLAAASGEDLASVSDIVTDALTAFGMSASDSGHFADVLAQASSNANTNVAMLGESFKYVAPVCGSMGYNAEDASIALGLMANSGIKASQAGMTLKNAIVNMASPTKQMQGVMDQYGLSLQNADGSMKSLKEVMDMLRNKMGGLDQATQAAAASTLFGKESMAGMLAVINASDSDYQKLTDAIYNADGAAQQMADTMNDNLQGQITLLKSACEGLGIQLYESMDNPMKDIVKSANDMVSQLSHAFESGGFEGLTEELGTVFAEIVSGISDYAPALIDASITVIQSFIKGLDDNMDSISSSAGKIVECITKGIIELIPSLAQLGVDILGGIGKGISEGLENAFPELSTIFDPIKEAFQWIMDNSEKVVGALVSIGTGLAVFEIGSTIVTFVEAIKSGEAAVKALAIAQAALNLVMEMNPFVLIASVIAGAVAAVIYFWNTNEDFRNAVIEAWQSICDTCNEVWTSVCDFFTNTIPSAFDSCCDSVSNFCDSVVSFFTEDIPSAVESVGEWFAELPNNIAYGLGEAVGTVANWAVETYDTLSNGASDAIDAVGEWFSNLPSVMADGLSSAIDSIINWGSEIVSDAESAASSTISAIGNWFSQLPSSIAIGLSGALSALVSWGSEMLSSAVSACTEVANGIVNAFTSLPSRMAEIGSNIVAGIKNGIANAWNGMVGWIGGLCSSFIDGVKAQFDIHSPSRVMRDQVGKFIPLGIVEGLKLTGGDLIASATNMAQTVINAVKTTFNSNSLIDYSKETAEAMVQQFRSTSGQFEALQNELWSAEENYDWWSSRKVDDNKWYAEAKTQLDEIKDKIKQLKDSKSDLTGKENKNAKEAVEAEIKAWETTQKEAEASVEYYKKAAQEEIDANKQKYKIELNTAKEHKKQLETLVKGLTSAIKEQLSQQKEAALNTIASEMDKAEEAYNKEYDRIDKRTEKKKNAIQSEIDALDEQKEAEDRLKEVQEANNNIAVLQAKMNNTASEADKKAYALKIKNAKAALEAKKAEWDRTDEKARLKEEQDEIEERAKRKKERLKEDYEEEKEALEKKKKATEEYYETLLETDNLNAQVRYRMLNDSNEQLVQLLNSYAPYWQDAGQSLADSLINGLNSKREDMAHAVANMTELRGSLNGYASGTSNNRIAGMYTVDEKGFEISTGNNPVAYVSRGAGILNHMQSLKAIKDEVSSQVANQMQALKNLVLGQQQQMYQLAGAMVGVVNNSSSIREGDINFNVENFNNDRNDSIENIANELGFYAKRKKRC